MPIIHYPGYISKAEAAVRQNVQVRAINDQIKRKAIPHAWVDGFAYIKDPAPSSSDHPNILLKELVWVPRYARQHHFIPERLYEEIIIGKVTGVVLVDHVFVVATDRELATFLKSVGKR
jgi:hypothetical protein